MAGSGQASPITGATGGTMTGAELIDRVLYLVGRKDTTATLPLNAIILDALNEAQRRIANRVPNMLDLTVVDTTTFDATTDQYEYDLTTLDPALNHLQRVFVLNGLSSDECHFRGRDWFDRLFPDVSAVTAGFPTYWTRRASTLVFSCPFSSTYNGLALRLDYQKKPTAFPSVTTDQTCDIADADHGLILFAQAEALRAIGRSSAPILNAALAKEGEFEHWLTEFEDYHDLETEENTDDRPGTMLYEEF